MTQPAPSSHAVRAGAWALLLTLAIDLAVDLGFGFTQYKALSDAHDFDARDAWFYWLEWLDLGWLPLQGMVVALVVLALVRLRRGACEPVARNLFLGAAIVSGLRLAALVTMEVLFNQEGRDFAAWEALHGRLRLGVTLADRVAIGLMLAGLWRVRRAWGRGVGPAWTLAVAVFGLRAALVLASMLGLFAAREVDTEALLSRHLLVHGMAAAELGALAAALVAFARAAPQAPAAERWTAAAAGLDTYFRAVVARVTVLIVGVLLLLMLAIGSPPSTRAVVLVGVLALQLPIVVVQVAGLTRYADAPASIARGGLWTALVVIGLGLAFDCLVVAALARAAWRGASSSWGARVPSPAMLSDVAAVAQALALVGGVSLLLSLRRAAESVGSPALEARARALLAALVAVAAVGAGLVFGAGKALARSPYVLLGLGVVALVVGVTMFIGWLRLIEGVAREMRQRSTEP